MADRKVYHVVWMLPESFSELEDVTPAGIKPRKLPYKKTINEEIHDEYEVLSKFITYTGGEELSKKFGFVSNKPTGPSYPDIAKRVKDNPTAENKHLGKFFQLESEGMVIPKPTQNLKRFQNCLNLVVSLSEDGTVPIEFIIYITGHGNKHDGSIKLPNGETVSPATFYGKIVENNVNNVNIRLTIILDTCFSGFWVTAIKDLCEESGLMIAVQASANEQEEVEIDTFIPFFVNYNTQKHSDNCSLDVWKATYPKQSPCWFRTQEYEEAGDSPILFIGEELPRNSV